MREKREIGRIGRDLESEEDKKTVEREKRSSIPKVFSWVFCVFHFALGMSLEKGGLLMWVVFERCRLTLHDDNFQHFRVINSIWTHDNRSE